jgi:hypothetical protein
MCKLGNVASWPTILIADPGKTGIVSTTKGKYPIVLYQTESILNT